jgi:hypothetical protein
LQSNRAARKQQASAVPSDCSMRGPQEIWTSMDI